MQSKQPHQTLTEQSDSIFETIITNTAGLVCCFQLPEINHISFVYLSDSCKQLLGLPKNMLMEQPDLFFNIMLREDLARFCMMASQSEESMQVLNWEGRIWVEEWGDFKWLNLRATPRRIHGGVTQWGGVMTNITQSMKEKLEVIESREQLAKISIQLDYVKEEERKRISREIHDDIGGNLTAIKIGINGLQLKLDDHQKVLKDKALYLLSIVDATFEAVHKIVSDLRPDILELGIVEALSWQTKEFEKRMDISCHFSSNKEEITLDSNQEVALYRICQEAFSNISKYAQAKHVSVILNCLPEHIMMQIEDDGLGMQPSERFKENSFGIKGMSERVVALDGDFNIDSDPKKGTTITMKLPIQRFNDNAVFNAEDKDN